MTKVEGYDNCWIDDENLYCMVIGKDGNRCGYSQVLEHIKPLTNEYIDKVFEFLNKEALKTTEQREEECRIENELFDAFGELLNKQQ